jgi:predicted Zn-dependent peptidase
MTPPPSGVHREVLPNGLTILVEPMESRSVALGFWVRSGSADEPADKGGVTHFIEHLLFKRTKNRSNRQIAQLIDQLGGDVDAFTSKENTAFYARVEPRRVTTTLDLLADIVRSPVFALADIEKERKVILEEIAMVEDSPDDLVTEMFLQRYWKGHPLGRPVLGTPESVSAITPADVAETYRNAFAPANMVFSAAGGFSVPDLVAAVRDRFGSLSWEVERRRLRPTRPHPHVTVRKKGEMEQVQLLLGFDAPPTNEPLRFACTLLNVMLGGGVSSRMFHDLREKRGLVYTCGSFWSGLREGGYECLFAATRKENVRKVLDSMTKIVREVKANGFRPSEIRRAKENVVASFLLGLDSTTGRMSGLARQELYLDRVWSIDEIVAAIEEVTPEELRAAAERLFRPKTVSLAMLGPIEKSPIGIAELADEFGG